MRNYKLTGFLLVITLLATMMVSPAMSATATAHILAPASFIAQSGSTSGSVSSLGILDQSNADDTPSSYVSFQAFPSHLGYAGFQLPDFIYPNKISTLILQTNFKSSNASSQRWSWSAYNWFTKQWNKLGDSAGATDNQWKIFVFRIRSVAPYISPTGEIRIQLKANKINGDAKLDYLALHITYTSATPTPTRTKTVTPPPAKGGYVFPITHTPSPTNTPTITPTPTNTATKTPTKTPTQGSGFIWPEIVATEFKSGFSSPVHITHANDGTDRIFVVEKCGTIKIIENGNTLGTDFLNISGRLSCNGERGLLSMAFPPGYTGKNYFYVFYTDTSGTLTISRFHVPGGTPNQADPDDEDVILTIPHSASNHNGGQIAFGNDGYLYISTGDGGGSGDPDNNGQDKDSLLGKLLRIDVESGSPTYDVPASNPFVDDDGDDRIWAWGLRNPWRFSFDRQTHDLYIGDVGQGNWEEVDFQSASSAGGENYGWRIREGDHCYNPSSGCGTPESYVPPVTEYSHSLGCSVTGGNVYHGSEFTNMEGIYFYGDYCSGRIWGLKQENDTWYNQMLLDTSHNISSFGEDEAGNLYMANLQNGIIYKIESTNTPPALAGCPMFPADNIWNARVDSLPVHSRSSQWINSIGSNVAFHMDFGSGTWNGEPIGIPYNIVSGSSVTNYIVDFYYPGESDAGPYPIPSNPNIEGGSDDHILIVDTDDCTLYEIFDASFSGGQWDAGSGAIWDLNSNALRLDTWTSADAAGLPILPGLVRYDEILAGRINHAIRFTVENTNSYIWPARHLTSGTPGVLTSTPPMGARFRLKASFDISGYPAEMQVILRAMKEYGIILADNGSDWYISGVPDERWDNDMLHLLDDLTGSNFEAVDSSGLMVNIDSGQATP